MAFLTKKEFADLCGMTTGNLSNYITRKKVFPSGDLIDDTFAANKEFLEKWSTINAAKIVEGQKDKVLPPPPAMAAPGAMTIIKPTHDAPTTQYPKTKI